MSVTLYAYAPELRGVPSIQEWADHAWKLYVEHATACSVCGIEHLVQVNGQPLAAKFDYCDAGREILEHANALNAIADGPRIRG